MIAVQVVESAAHVTSEVINHTFSTQVLISSGERVNALAACLPLRDSAKLTPPCQVVQELRGLKP